MSTEASATLRRTKDSLLSKKIPVFFSLFSLTSFLFIVAVQSRIAATEQTGALEEALPAPFVEASAVALGVPRWAAVVMSFISLFVGSYFAVVFIRTLVNDYDSVPRSAYTENVVKPTVHFFLDLLAFAPLFFAGLILLVLPGAFVAISFAFFVVYTAVEGDDFVDALIHSWRFSSGNRLPLFLLFGAFLLAGVFLVAVGLGLYIVVWNVSTVLAEVMLALGAAAILVFTLTLVTSAYNTLESAA